MTTQELKQVEGVKKVIAEKGEPARQAAEQQKRHLEREIKAAKQLTERDSPGITERTKRMKNQLRVINSALLD